MTARAVVLVAVVLAALAAPGAAEASRCSTARGTTIATSATARVFFVERGRAKLPVTFGCLYGGRVIRVDDRDGGRVQDYEFGHGPIAFAGDMVAAPLFARTTVDFAIDCGFEEVAVMDLRTGRRLLTAEDGDGCVVERTVARLVLRPSGAAAWGSAYGIGRAIPGRRGRFAYDWSKTALDRSRSVRPRSLRLSGSLISWISHGHRHYATLR